MGINRVNLSNGETLMDISGDTVTEDTLGEGSTAHNSNGEKIVGKAVFGGGAVTSVNGKTGAVVLSAEDIPHTHSWDEIENKPGTGGEELLLSYTLNELSRESDGWNQHFNTAPNVTLGETVRVRISSNDSIYERDCKVLSDDGFMCGIPFNNSAYSEESIDNGTYDYAAVPIESGVPSLLLYMVPGASCEVYADRNYMGANIEIIRSTAVKLGNEALYVTDKATEGSDYLITSGGVFDALSSAGGGGSSDVLMIPCYLDLATMTVRADNDQLIVTTSDIVEAFNSNKAIYLKCDTFQMVDESDKAYVNFSYVIAPMTQCLSVKDTDQYTMYFDFMITINHIPHIVNVILRSSSSAGNVTMTPLATLS